MPKSSRGNRNGSRNPSGSRRRGEGPRSRPQQRNPPHFFDRRESSTYSWPQQQQQQQPRRNHRDYRRQEHHQRGNFYQQEHYRQHRGSYHKEQPRRNFFQQEHRRQHRGENRKTVDKNEETDAATIFNAQDSDADHEKQRPGSSLDLRSLHGKLKPSPPPTRFRVDEEAKVSKFDRQTPVPTTTAPPASNADSYGALFPSSDESESPKSNPTEGAPTDSDRQRGGVGLSATAIDDSEKKETPNQIGPTAPNEEQEEKKASIVEFCCPQENCSDTFGLPATFPCVKDGVPNFDVFWSGKGPIQAAREKLKLHLREGHSVPDEDLPKCVASQRKSSRRFRKLKPGHFLYPCHVEGCTFELQVPEDFPFIRVVGEHSNTKQLDTNTMWNSRHSGENSLVNSYRQHMRESHRNITKQSWPVCIHMKIRRVPDDIKRKGEGPQFAQKRATLLRRAKALNVPDKIRLYGTEAEVIEWIQKGEKYKPLRKKMKGIKADLFPTGWSILELSKKFPRLVSNRNNNETYAHFLVALSDDVANSKEKNTKWFRTILYDCTQKASSIRRETEKALSFYTRFFDKYKSFSLFQQAVKNKGKDDKRKDDNKRDGCFDDKLCEELWCCLACSYLLMLAQRKKLEGFTDSVDALSKCRELEKKFLADPTMFGEKHCGPGVKNYLDGMDERPALKTVLAASRVILGRNLDSSLAWGELHAVCGPDLWVEGFQNIFKTKWEAYPVFARLIFLGWYGENLYYDGWQGLPTRSKPMSSDKLLNTDAIADSFKAAKQVELEPEMEQWPISQKNEHILVALKKQMDEYVFEQVKKLKPECEQLNVDHQDLMGKLKSENVDLELIEFKDFQESEKRKQLRRMLSDTSVLGDFTERQVKLLREKFPPDNALNTDLLEIADAPGMTTENAFKVLTRCLACCDQFLGRRVKGQTKVAKGPEQETRKRGLGQNSSPVRKRRKRL